MITPEKISSTPLPHYAPDGTHLGDFNDLENLYFRIRIAEERLEGYYILDQKGERFDIESDGFMPGYPEGFDQYSDGLIQLFRIQRKIREKQ